MAVEELLALGRAELGQAQFHVPPRGADELQRQHAHHVAQRAPDAQQLRIGEQDHQPEQEQPDPGGPVPRSEQPEVHCGPSSPLPSWAAWATGV